MRCGDFDGVKCQLAESERTILELSKKIQGAPDLHRPGLTCCEGLEKGHAELKEKHDLSVSNNMQQSAALQDAESALTEAEERYKKVVATDKPS